MDSTFPGSLRIGVNIVDICRPGLVGGIESYIRNILAALGQFDSVNQYFVFCQPEMARSLALPTSSMTPIVVDERPVLNRCIRKLQRVLNATYLPATALDREVERCKLDLMFYPGTVIFPPVKSHVPIVLTIADIQQEFHPEFFSYSELRRRNQQYRPSAVLANRIIAVSEFTRGSLIEKYRISSQKIDVVHELIDAEFYKVVSQSSVDRVRNKYGLPKKYLLYPAATWPHKNHRRLLEALAMARTRNSESAPRVVLFGMMTEGYRSILSDIDRLGLRDLVQMLGYIPYEDIPALYSAGAGLIFPSLFEGFGIPLVEAMAVGLPIACSRLTSLPEIAESAALYFDPMNVAEIESALVGLWSDDVLGERLRRNGTTRLQQFRPSTIAVQTMQVFSRAFASTRRSSRDSCENK